MRGSPFPRAREIVAFLLSFVALTTGTNYRLACFVPFFDGQSINQFNFYSRTLEQ